MAGGSQFDSAYKERTGSCRTDYYKVGGRHRIRERPKWGRASYLILLGSTTKLTSTFGWLHVKCLLQYINIVIRYDSAKASDCVDHNELWKILKEMGIPDHPTCLMRTCIQVRKQQLELDMEQQTGSKLEKEYIKAVYCHPAYLTSMQSTS